MIYLSGTLYPLPNVGMMLSPNSSKHVPEGVPFACDNGCYSAPARYSDARFLAWLAGKDPAHCLFAVAPDVVGDAAATWARSAPLLPRLRAVGYRAALAAQNGWDGAAVDWGACDAVLLGGDDTFKLGDEGRRAAADALAHGKWLHMGRVNSRVRLAYAAGLGCHSADGTTIAFNPGRYVPEIGRWLTAVNAPRLLEVTR